MAVPLTSLPRDVIDNVAEKTYNLSNGRKQSNENQSNSDGGGLFETSSQAQSLSKDRKGRPDGDPVNIDMLTISVDKPDPKNITDWFSLAKDIASEVEEKKKKEKEAYTMLVAFYIDGMDTTDNDIRRSYDVDSFKKDTAPNKPKPEPKKDSKDKKPKG